jgi:uncharacterized membrane protein YdjX (TVP38/TMEM64 family)
MARYGALVAAVMGGLLAVFLLFGALAPGSFESMADIPRARLAAAAAGVLLLSVDVVVPVPSSLVMVALGARFGVVTGTLLSLSGMLGAGLAGYWLGRAGAGTARHVVPAAAWTRADRWLMRWGPAAIVASRPIPILAETVVMLAGASRMAPRQVALATVVGSIPPALVYALIGAAVASADVRAAAFAGCVAITLVTLALSWARRR